MSIQKLFSIILLGISSIGIFGSLSLDLLATNNVGPGFLPLTYSILLATCSIALFFSDKGKESVELKCLLKRPQFDSLFFYLMTFIFYILAKTIGMIVSIGVFSTILLLQQNKMKKIYIILFEIVFMFIIYVLFVIILGIPFEKGLVFG